MNQSKLQNGLIPAHCDCPYRGYCEINLAGKCKQLGDKHPVAFSCASARAFDLVHVYKGEYK